MLAEINLALLTLVVAAALSMFVPPRDKQNQARALIGLATGILGFLFIAPFVEPLKFWLLGDAIVGMDYIVQFLFLTFMLVVGVLEYASAGWIEQHEKAKRDNFETND